jgi:hypothetical protein
MTENLRTDNHDCSAIGGSDPWLSDNPDNELPWGFGDSAMAKSSASKSVDNHLFYGDNLDIMKNKIADESVDLIYLDPPFKSGANYNLLFQLAGDDAVDAQIEAFKDTWKWGESAERAYDDVRKHGKLGLALSGIHLPAGSLKMSDTQNYGSILRPLSPS